MTTNRVRINLDLQCRYRDVIPEIKICVDYDVFACRRLDQLHDPVVIDTRLMPGSHSVSIDFDDHAAVARDPALVVTVRSLKFQYLPDEFNIYSFYRPDYPEHWIKENLAQGHVLAPVIHSNHIGWCGRWWVDFETPIYTWIHRKLDLGWLLD